MRTDLISDYISKYFRQPLVFIKYINVDRAVARRKQGTKAPDCQGPSNTKIKQMKQTGKVIVHRNLLDKFSVLSF